MPLKSGGAVDNEQMRGRTTAGLINIGKTGPTNLYAALYAFGVNGGVVKIDIETFSKVSTLAVGSGLTSLVRNGDFLYAGDDYRASSENVGKIDLETFTLLVWSASADDRPFALIVDGNYLYACSYMAPSKISKIDLTTFTLASSLTLASGENYGAALAIKDNFLYVGLEDPGPASIAKINLNTFTEVGILTLDTGESWAEGFAISGDYLYVGCGFSSPGKIVKIDLTTFTKVSTLTLASGENDVASLVISGGYLYAGCDTSPARIVKIDLSTFTRVGAVTFDTGENGIAIFDGLLIIGDFLYVACDSPTPGKIVKVDLTTFTKTATLTLDSGENYVMALGGR